MDRGLFLFHGRLGHVLHQPVLAADVVNIAVDGYHLIGKALNLPHRRR